MDWIGEGYHVPVNRARRPSVDGFRGVPRHTSANVETCDPPSGIPQFVHTALGRLDLPGDARILRGSRIGTELLHGGGESPAPGLLARARPLARWSRTGRSR